MPTPRRRAAVALLLGALAALFSQPVTSTATPAPADGDDADRVDAYLDEWAESNHTPGVAVLVVEGGRVVHEHLAGEDGDGHEITADTPFLIGSVAKTMTATLILELADDGLLSLDDRVSEHIDFLDAADPTIAQLLTHTAGFSGGDGLTVADRGDSDRGAMRRAVEDLDHSGDVGDYAYTSADYLVLGAVIEEVTGERFDHVLAERLTGPVGLEHTGASRHAVDAVPPGHRLWWGRPIAHDPGYDASGAPYTGVASTPADLARYAQAQLGTVRGIPPRIREQAQQPRVASSQDHYGYGWSLTELRGEPVVQHTGATPGFFTHVLLVPGKDTAIVVLANTYAEARAPSLTAAAPDVWRSLQGEDREPVGGDPVLGALPWVLAGLALMAVPVAVAARRRVRRGWVRAGAAGGCAVLVLTLWLLPGLVGQNHHVLRTWMPDSAWAAVVGMLTWAAAGLAFAVPHRKPVHARQVATGAG